MFQVWDNKHWCKEREGAEGEFIENINRMGWYYIHYQQMEASRACIMKAKLQQI
jgi:hypothetical protein